MAAVHEMVINTFNEPTLMGILGSEDAHLNYVMNTGDGWVIKPHKFSDQCKDVLETPSVKLLLQKAKEKTEITRGEFDVCLQEVKAANSLIGWVLEQQKGSITPLLAKGGPNVVNPSGDAKHRARAESRSETRKEPIR